MIRFLLRQPPPLIDDIFRSPLPPLALLPLLLLPRLMSYAAVYLPPLDMMLPPLAAADAAAIDAAMMPPLMPPASVAYMPYAMMPAFAADTRLDAAAADALRLLRSVSSSASPRRCYSRLLRC